MTAYAKNRGAWVDIEDDDEFPGAEDLVTDDWQEMLQRRGNAYHGAPSELHAEARIRELRQADLIQQPTPGTGQTAMPGTGQQVRITPPSAYKAQKGSQVIVISNQPALPLIAWTGEEIESQPVTFIIQNLGRFVSTSTAVGQGYFAWPSASGVTAQYRPYAIVQFGNGANLTTFNVDIGRGIQMTVCGSSVYVSVALDVNGTPATQVAMSIGGSLAFFACQKNAPIMRTGFVDSLAAAGTQAIVIPSFAQTLLPVQMDDGAGTGQARLSFRDVSTGVLYRLDIGSPGAQTTPIPIANDVYDVLITNTGANTTTYRLPFQLCF